MSAPSRPCREIDGRGRTVSWRPYPEYRASGVQWLGAIPAHWDLRPIRALAAREHKAFTDGDWIESPFIRDEGIRLIQTGNVGVGEYREQGSRYIDEQTYRDLRCTEVLPGDVLICRLADPVGRACLAPQLGCRMITSVDVCILRPACDVWAPFLVHLLSSSQYLGWLEGMCRGGTRDRVSRSMLGAIRVQVPPLPEQRTIAAFLDRKTAQIDALIARKEQLIELLEEKRTALITQAVTKGLDPNVPMKDSGVEWLGRIPAHWGMAALKHSLLVPVTDGPHETPQFVPEGVPFLSAESVKDDQLDFSRKRGNIASEDHARFSRKYRPARGDVLMVKSGATTGSVARVTTDADFNVWSPLAAMRPHTRRLTTDFLFYAVKSRPFQANVQQGWSYGTQQNIAMGAVANLSFVRPPLLEQREIAAHLDGLTAETGRLIEAVRRAVVLLHEYRTALISAAVTGRIDVRSEAA